MRVKKIFEIDLPIILNVNGKKWAVANKEILWGRKRDQKALQHIIFF